MKQRIAVGIAPFLSTMKIPVYKRNRVCYFFCPAAHSALGLKARRVGFRAPDW